MHQHETTQRQPGPGGMGTGRMGMMGHRPGMGMMGGMGMCPMCGRRMGMAEEPEEGPYRGVGPARRGDEQIQGDVEAALTEDSWLDASGIQVSVAQGVVTLAGMVADRAAKRRAEDVADGVAGVQDVQNNLHFGAGGGQTA